MIFAQLFKIVTTTTTTTTTTIIIIIIKHVLLCLGLSKKK
jgi:hypothetical protein